LGHNAFGVRGVLNDAISIYFADATLASAFAARWCQGSKAETAGGVFQGREDGPAPRIEAGCTALLKPAFASPTPVSALRSD